MPGEIKESAVARLQSSGYFALRDVGCAYKDGILTLHGCLPSYYLKQLAQMAVADVEGVTAIVNQIAVVTPMQRQAVGRSEEPR
jgi:osmotically-inducible protein OsmY